MRQRRSTSPRPADGRLPVSSMILLPLLLVALLPAGLLAADWPQWRGPERNGQSAESGLMDSWPEGGPPLLWRTDGLGNGYSSMSIAGGRIFTLGDKDGSQYVIARQQTDGAALWTTRIGPAHDDRYLGSRSTPTVDGDRIFAVGTEGDVVALEAATGKELWRRSLTGDFGGDLMKAGGRTDWRFAESPLIDGEKLIVTPGAKDAVMVALSKEDGSELWRAALPDVEGPGIPGAGYSSAVISNGGGVKQYVQLVGQGAIGVRAADGRVLWVYPRVANDVANIATPLVDGDRVFVSSGYGTGAALLELKGDGNGGVDASEVYFLEASTFQNHHGGMILHDGYVYSGTGHNKGFPIALKMDDGEVAWGPVRTDGKSSSAVTFADGRLYFRFQDGRMILVEATPQEYRQAGTFMIPDVERESWSHPVIADGKLYLREQDNLLCYDISAR